MSWKNLEVEIEQRTEPDATIYKIAGVLTDTPDAFELLKTVREGLSKGPELHILDLTDVPHVTSAGVGIVAAALTTSHREKKRLALAAPSSRVESLLKVVGMWGMIEHYESVDEALQK